jgi:putative transposase
LSTSLKGFPDAINVFPQAMVQTCVVHLLRHSLDFVSWKDRKPIATALKGHLRGRRCRRRPNRTDGL